MLLLEVILKLGLMSPVMEMSVSDLVLIHPERLRVTDFKSMTCFTLLCRRDAAIVISCSILKYSVRYVLDRMLFDSSQCRQFLKVSNIYLE